MAPELTCLASPRDVVAIRTAIYAFCHSLALKILGPRTSRLALKLLLEPLNYWRNLEVPTLIVTGDEDDPCLEPGLLMKRTIPTAALVVFPNTGHAVNLEEPELFNRSCAEFFHQVESGRWPRRDPRSVTGSILGVR